MANKIVALYPSGFFLSYLCQFFSISEIIQFRVFFYMITYWLMTHFGNQSLETSRHVQAHDPTFQNASIQRDLRYILTQKCNYQCSFCHKEWCDGSEKNLLKADDYDFLFSTAKEALWINQVTLSGGEPMMRKDIWDISERLKRSGAKITMVSNWAIISKHPEVMKHIDVLNLSLHTTNQEIYTTLTWSSTKVKDLIHDILHIHEYYPHLQIKLNSAMIKDQNTPDTEDFLFKLELATRHGWNLKYMELSDRNIPDFVDKSEFEKNLLTSGFIPDHTTPRQSIYRKNDVDIITCRVFCSEAKQTQDPQWYCKRYNDIYITPDGYLSSCPIDVKKFSAYSAIVSKDIWTLSRLLEKAVGNDTSYQCPF